jgi:hypothetical protein
MVAGTCPAHTWKYAYVSTVCRLTLVKYKCYLGNGLMLVSGFDGNEPYNSGSGTGSLTVIRLALWEDQANSKQSQSPFTTYALQQMS